MVTLFPMLNMSSPKPTVANKVRSWANHWLAKIGFQLTRCERLPGTELRAFKIGKYELLIHTNNSLWVEYGKNSEYTAQLARLAHNVFEKYPAACMIDVGANIGDTAALVRSTVAAPIYCIEGDPTIYDLLKKNIAVMPQVFAHQCFLGERTETLEVMTAKDGWDLTLIPVNVGENQASKPMSLLSLDDWSKQVRLSSPCKLLKLDIEGFDLRALRGATQLLTIHQPALLFEFNHQNLTKLGEDGLKIFPHLANLGYDRLMVYDGQGFFMLASRLAEMATLTDLDAYAKNVAGLFYYDFCVFHQTDNDLAETFLVRERQHRQQIAKPGEIA